MSSFGEDPEVTDADAPPEEERSEESGEWDADALADEMSEESFPSSDPPSTWTGEDRGHD